MTLRAHQGYGTDEFFSQNITSDAEGVAKFTVDNIPANFTHLNFYVSRSILKCAYLGGGDEVKRTFSNKKNLQITLQIKKNTFKSQHVPFFSKNRIM